MEGLKRAGCLVGYFLRKRRNVQTLLGPLPANCGNVKLNPDITDFCKICQKSRHQTYYTVANDLKGFKVVKFFQEKQIQTCMPFETFVQQM